MTFILTHIARLTDDAPRLLSRALGSGGRHADLFFEHTTHHRAAWRQEVRRRAIAPPVQEHERRLVEGIGIQVLGDKKVGFAATDDLAAEALGATADAAAAQRGRTGPLRRAQPITTPSIHLDVPADAPDAIAASEKTALMQAAADAAFSLDDRVRSVAMAYHDRVRRILVATADGVLRAAASMMLGLRLEVTLATADGPVTAYAVAGGACGFGHFFDHPPENLARAAVERARRRIGAKPTPVGVMPVVLAGGWGGVWLHEAVGHFLEADAVAAGASPFAGCLGRPVAAPTITLVDDATLAGGRGSHRFDDEAAPAARTTLIEAGVLRSVLTDRRTAAALALPRTGSARRQDYRHAPLPRMTNLLLLPGETDPADLIADVADGLYVEVVGHGVAQPGGGFSFDVLEGYRVERGRLGAPVAGARLVGAGPDVLRAVVGVGRNLQVETARGVCKKAGQVVPVSVGMPTVLVGAMAVERV